MEDELEKLLMSELVPQLHELASRSGKCQKKLLVTYARMFKIIVHKVDQSG